MWHLPDNLLMQKCWCHIITSSQNKWCHKIISLVSHKRDPDSVPVPSNVFYENLHGAVLQIITLTQPLQLQILFFQMLHCITLVRNWKYTRHNRSPALHACDSFAGPGYFGTFSFPFWEEKQHSWSPANSQRRCLVTACARTRMTSLQIHLERETVFYALTTTFDVVQLTRCCRGRKSWATWKYWMGSSAVCGYFRYAKMHT